MLDFGYRNDGSYPNPHSYSNSTNSVMVLDGINQRVGIKNINPAHPLDVNGSIRTSSGGTDGFGAIYFGHHTLYSDNNNWLYLGDEAGTAYGSSTGLATGKLWVHYQATFKDHMEWTTGKNFYLKGAGE